MLRRILPHGLTLWLGPLVLLLLAVVLLPAAGGLTARAENVTEEQRQALVQQEEAARAAREAAQRQQALEARLARFVAAGSQLDVQAVPESTLDLAERIAGATPLDLRSSLAAAVYARQFSLRPSLLLAVISKESNFNQFSVGSHRDRGYMQIIPATERFMAKWFGPGLGMPYNPKKIFDPEYNLGLGGAYLGYMISQYGDVERALTEYNRGEGRTETFFKRNGTYSTSYSRAVLELEQRYLSLN